MPLDHHEGQCSCSESVPPLVHKSLLPFIRIEGVYALNESVSHSVKTLFKPYQDRFQDANGCKSNEDDHQLIVHIPFVAPCKITGIRCIGGEDGTSPSELKLYINKDMIDFASIQDEQPAQTVELVEDLCGTVEYPLKATKFSSVSHLTLYFTETYGASTTQLLYIGLYGEGTTYKRETVSTVYEARPNLSDHQVNAPSMHSTYNV